MSAGSSLPTDRLDRFRELLERSDAALVLTAMAAFYLLFLGIGAILNYNLAGLISILGQVTFFTAVYALIVLALNLHWGYAGLFNIGIAGFMAVGVYTMANGLAARPRSPGRGRHRRRHARGRTDRPRDRVARAQAAC